MISRGTKPETVEKYLGAIKALKGKATIKRIGELVGVKQCSAYIKLVDLVYEGYVEIRGLYQEQKGAKASRVYGIIGENHAE